MLDQRDALELGRMLAKDIEKLNQIDEILKGIFSSKHAALYSLGEERAIKNLLIYIKNDLNVAVRALPGERPPSRG